MKKLWINNNTLVTADNKVVECDDCPCSNIFTISAGGDCSCGGRSGLSLGVLDGNYRLTYLSGAVCTQSGQMWNHIYTATRICMPGGAHAIYIGRGNYNGVLAPGFSTAGYASANSAELACKDTYIDYSFDGSANIIMWYDDDVCGDNIGSIAYSLEKLS